MCILYLSFFIVSISSNSSPYYGDFDLLIQKFETCKGPKRMDCAIVKSKVIDDSKIYYDMIVTRNMRPTKTKITATSNGKQLVRLQASDPCNHLFLQTIFQTLLNVSSNCVVLKGHYGFELDIGEVAKNYYQGAFLYGNITFKSIFFNDECNLSCSLVKVNFSPKHKHNTTHTRNKRIA